MSIEQTRAQVIGSVWQAIAQSDVDLSSVPYDQQEKLVAKIADSVMIAIDAMLDEEQTPPVEQPVDDTEETVLWEGRPFLSLVESYILTNERIRITRGLFSRQFENFELIRVQDLDVKQGLNERMLGIGDITIRGQDPSDPEIVLRNVHKPNDVYEILRKAWLASRKKHGLQFREFM